MTYPRTRSGEEKHAKKKRELEISIAIKSISRYLMARSIYKGNNILILEFGSVLGSKYHTYRTLAE